MLGSKVCFKLLPVSSQIYKVLVIAGIVVGCGGEGLTIKPAALQCCLLIPYTDGAHDDTGDTAVVSGGDTAPDDGIPSLDQLFTARTNYLV